MDELQQDALNTYRRIDELTIEAGDLKDELEHDPKYLRMRACEEEINQLMTDLKERALTTLKIRGEKTSVGDFGKITLVNHETFKVSDEKLVPEKYFTRAVDMKAVKKDITLLHKQIDGITYTNTQSVRITPKQPGESS